MSAGAIDYTAEPLSEIDSGGVFHRPNTVRNMFGYRHANTFHRVYSRSDCPPFLAQFGPSKKRILGIQLNPPFREFLREHAAKQSIKEIRLTDQQLHTLRHMLGINTPDDRYPNPHRNYAAVNPGEPEYMELERLGVVEQYQPRGGSPYHYYRCTEKGRQAACASHRKIRKPLAARRYSMFLDMTDVAPDLTFWEFLTQPQWKEARAQA